MTIAEVSRQYGVPVDTLRYYDPEIYHTEDWGEKEIVAYYGWTDLRRS